MTKISKMTKILDENEIKDTAYHLLEIAKILLKRDGYVSPVGFLFTKEGMKGALLKFEGREGKNACIEKFKELAKEQGAYAIIMITEAWMAEVENEQIASFAGEYGVSAVPGRKEQINVSIVAPYLRMVIAQEIDTSDRGNPKIIGKPLELEHYIEGGLFDGLWDTEYNMVRSASKEIN